MAWTEDDVRKILANPIYCLGDQPIVDKELWIKAAKRAIKEQGTEKFLRNLLENLEFQLAVQSSNEHQ
jgi:hypothetical protein